MRRLRAGTFPDQPSPPVFSLYIPTYRSQNRYPYIHTYIHTLYLHSIHRAYPLSYHITSKSPHSTLSHKTINPFLLKHLCPQHASKTAERN